MRVISLANLMRNSNNPSPSDLEKGSLNRLPCSSKIERVKTAFDLILGLKESKNSSIGATPFGNR